MDPNTVQMGGILDLATTHSDIFIAKSNNGDSSPENHENIFQPEYSNCKKSEAWADYDDSFYNKQDMSVSRDFSDAADISNKTSSPDIIKQHKNKKDQPSDLPLHTSGPMIWSVCSSVAETPGDSGVQCLDSETSDLTSDCPAGMTLSLVEAEELVCDNSTCESQAKLKFENSESPIYAAKNKSFIDTDVMTQSDIENQNVTNMDSICNSECNGRVELPQRTQNGKQKSPEAIKSASDDIVFRRKCKKKTNQTQPKKRVSFHEDILNNTKTDNIHIEHGFVSYRPEVSMSYLPNNYFKKFNGSIARYSWCAVGDTPFSDSQNISGRNTKSDVLTYGRTDVTGYPDNSGIYEYENDSRYFSANRNKHCESETCINKVTSCKCSKEDTQKVEGNYSVERQLYMCSCSSSDSNLSSESETSSSQTLSLGSDTPAKYDAVSKKCDNTQKSYSCDCFENSSMKPLVKTMYFSEANINNSDSFEHLQMSEVLPKASCLKKSALKKKRYITTNVIEEHESSKKKHDNEKKIKSLLDSKNLFGSLKNIYKNINFGLSIAERGVPEGSEDCQSVSEVLPADSDESFLSRSFEPGTSYSYNLSNNDPRIGGDGFSRNSIQDNNLSKSQIASTGNRHENYNSSNMVQMNTFPRSKINDVSKQNLSLDMNSGTGKTVLDWKSQGNFSAREVYSNQKNLRNKYIVNCESTVYEHKGVSYCYEYDTFQTTFDTSKDTFTPITDTLKVDGNAPQSEEKSTAENTELAVALENKTVDSENVEKDIDDNKNSSIDLNTDYETSTESGDKSKFRLSRYFSDPSDSGKSGVSKHLSSPLKQRNIMRYEKPAKQSNSIENKDNEQCFDTNSTQDTLNESGDLDEILEISDGFDMTTKVINRKTSLINRFLKNVSQKKIFYSKLKENEFFQKKIQEESLKFPNICFPSSEKISPLYKQSAKYLDNLINKEVMENKRISVKLMTADEPSYFDSFEENVAMECCEKLKLELFRDSSEVLHRMLKVRSVYNQENGQWNAQLVFITDRALYVADVKSDKTSYNLLCYLTHDKLNLIVIGPDSQYVQIFDKSGSCQCILITGDRYLCHRLVSSLEWSSRNCHLNLGSSVMHGRIPSVVWKNRECLRRSLLKTTSFDKYEMCVFYGMVGSSAPASFNMGRPASPFGLTMEGFLMYKREKQRNWKPSFFLLKSGVLFYGSSTPKNDNLETGLPHSIDLKSVVGVRRCTDIHGRPYCFEIALGHSAGVLQMAAPDDDVASQWLQGLLMHAAQALEGPKSDLSKKILPPCCTLLATSKHIITLREDLETNMTLPNDWDSPKYKGVKNKDVSEQIPKDNVEILSFASIKDLTALKIPDNDDNWCILEFIFCEVHEGTEMGFLFGSSAELERFIATVESLWHTTNEGVFPISILSSTDSTSRKCSEWHSRLVTAWDRLLPTAQR